jgi:hypothetical protein
MYLAMHKILFQGNLTESERLIVTWASLGCYACKDDIKFKNLKVLCIPHRNGKKLFLKEKRMKSVLIYTEKTITKQKIMLNDLMFLLYCMDSSTIFMKSPVIGSRN